MEKMQKILLLLMVSVLTVSVAGCSNQLNRGLSNAKVCPNSQLVQNASICRAEVRDYDRDFDVDVYPDCSLRYIGTPSKKDAALFYFNRCMNKHGTDMSEFKDTPEKR